MGRYTGSKCHLCRRELTKLFIKGDRCVSAKCPIDKKGPVPPGQHGLTGRRRGPSEYGVQLREKQKVKRIYGIMEKQLRIYFERALKKRGSTGEELLRIIESRFDNIVYRLGFSPSRAAARQLIKHGLLDIDGKKVTTPSYQVKPDQIINLKSRALKIGLVKTMLGNKDNKPPSWLQKKAATGKMLKSPTRDEVGADIDEHLIVEHYSRR